MPEKKEKFIVDVAPLTKISAGYRQYFSYLYGNKLAVGSLVFISLFHRKLEGIVVGAKPYSKQIKNINFKEIERVIEEGFLTEKQLELARFIADYYMCPLGITLKFFIPKITKLRETNQKPEMENQKRPEIKLTEKQLNAVQAITQKNQRKFLLHGPASSGKTEVYIHAIKKIKKQNPTSQFLILLPEITLTPQAVERYGQYFGKGNIATLTSKISKGQFYKNWQEIKSGKIKIIIGTRLAVFAPFRKLGLIVIDEEQDVSFKQWDMSPRYDARTVAEKLSDIHNSKLVLGSATPSIDSYHKALEKEYQLLELPYLKITSKSILNYKLPDIEIVDLIKEHWLNIRARKLNRHSPISQKLQCEIEWALKNKFQTILFINRQGMSIFSVCDDCKTVLKCPRCERALIYDSDGAYHCFHCNYKTDLLAVCPNCKGMNFKNIGFGTQKIEAELKKFFPQAKIKRADFQSMKGTYAQENLYRDFSKGAIDILVGTQMITKGWDLPNIGLVGIIEVDRALNMPDFRTDEKIFQNVVQAIGRAGRLKSRYPGKIIIQTYNPNNSIIKQIAELDFKKFYAREIEERKTLNYPPFSQLVKIIFQDKNKEKSEKETGKIYQNILSLQEENKNFSVFEPQEPLAGKIRGKFRRQIVIKIKNKKISEQLGRLLKKLGKGWIVDVDPISLT